MVTRYQVDPDKRVISAISEALKKVDDLRIPFTLIGKSWFRSNEAIFKLKGPGKYKDLSPAYKIEKEAAVGFVYPILFRHGPLRDSITEPTDPNAVFNVTRQSLELGSTIDYGPKVQETRPFVLIGAEQVAPRELNQRAEAWVKTIESYVMQACANVGDQVS